MGAIIIGSALALATADCEVVDPTSRFKKIWIVLTGRWCSVRLSGELGMSFLVRS